MGVQNSTANGLKRITLCADDFAQSPAISDGILQLIDTGRIHATSVMTQSPHWPALASSLKSTAATRADVGLHFNLTHPFTQPAQGLGSLLLKAQLRQLPRAALYDEYLRQIDAFTQHYDALPDHIDGHQHVHAFHGARDALFQAIHARWPAGQLPYVRAPDQLLGVGAQWVEGRVVRWGASGFYHRARAHRLCVAPHFAGLYDLQPDAGFAERLTQWISQCPDQTLIMCHPGKAPATADNSDPIAPARSVEFAFLNSDAWLEQCTGAAVQLKRLSI